MNTYKKILTLLVGCLALSEAYEPVSTIFHTTASKFVGPKTTRIVGGNPASVDEYPHQVGVLSSSSITPGEEDGFCGGSLISSTAVLTAAHCVDTYRVHDVILGTLRVMDPSSSGYEKIAASDKILHPNFELSTLDYDIALILLSSPAPSTSNIRPVLLPKRSFGGTLDTYTGILTGWGKTSDGSGFLNEVLLEATNIDIVPNVDCYNHYGPTYVNDRKVCVSAKGGSQGPCHGDSGSPLTIRTTGIGAETIQVGLVSFGATAGCTSGYNFVFTRIQSYLDWIAANGGPAVRP